MGQERFKIVVAESMSEDALRSLAAVGVVQCLDRCDSETLRSSLTDAAALIVRSYAQVTADIIHAAPQLKVIGRAGIGVENIDTAAAREAGVAVVHTPAASTQAVAELTLGLILALERRVTWGQRELLEGRFIEARRMLCQRQLGQLVLGVVGFGRIGQRLAEMTHTAFGTKTIFNDIREIRSVRVPAEAVSKQHLYQQADIVTLHVPLTPQTMHLINGPVLQSMKNSALLINTARGAVVDAEALAAALRGGHIAGAASDVFDPEPPPPDHPLLDAPNVILTPHIASRTASALKAMNDVVSDVIAVLSGREPRYPHEDE